ncbi:MAG: hypothetical protein EOO76_02900 [Novosphingobium sp.]|nr:MAG: hypothetical protein EOO76_02900 [Novosphingobium sp.]
MSSELRERLVGEIVEDQPQLRAFLAHRSNDMLAGSWDMMAYSFQRGFEAIWDLARRDLSGLLVHPMLMLWRQSLELTMKASIRDVTGGIDKDLGHRLDHLFDRLLAARRELGLHDDDGYMQKVQTMIAEVQAFDPTADRFRYPATRRGEPFDGFHADLDKLYQVHWMITTWCEGAALEVEWLNRGD